MKDLDDNMHITTSVFLTNWCQKLPSLILVHFIEFLQHHQPREIQAHAQIAVTNIICFPFTI